MRSARRAHRSVCRGGGGGAAGGILMQDRCQRGFLQQLRTSPAARSPPDFRALSVHGSKLSSDLTETGICAVLSASTVLQPADDSRFTSYIRPNESTTRLTGTQQREWCGQHGRAEEAQDKRCTDLSVIPQDRAACWQRCGGSYVTALKASL